MCAKNIDFDFYKRILNELCFQNQKFEEFTRAGTKKSYYEFIRSINRATTIDIDGFKHYINFYDGVTKVCIVISDDCDYVIKIGFTDDGYQGYAFLEESIYRAACAKNVEKFFAGCYLLGRFFAVDCYLMQYADIDGSAVDDDVRRHISDDLDERGEKYNDEDIDDAFYDIIDDCAYVEYLFPFYYNKEEVSKLLDFIYRYDINDLHNENIGYINGMLVLTDYSGFKSSNAVKTAKNLLA